MEEQKLTLTFLSEQTGVTLRIAKYKRGFKLNSDEYQLYSSLFNVADSSNSSSLSSEAFTSLLYCTSLSNKTIESLVTFVQTTSEIFHDPSALTLEDWLVVCKLVEHLQHDSIRMVKCIDDNGPNCVVDQQNTSSSHSVPSSKKKNKDKKNRDEGKETKHDKNSIQPSSSLKGNEYSEGLSVLDVRTCLESLVMGTLSDDMDKSPSSGRGSSVGRGDGNSAHGSIQSKNMRSYANFWCRNGVNVRSDDNVYIEIGSMGWERVIENELRSHYTYKFKCKTNSCKYACKEWTIVRRFSDFDTFCTTILRLSHLGAVLPPLPPKYFSADEKVASQREVDLLLFLREAIKYPILAYSYEFKAFLEASQSGMDTLKQFYEKDYERLIFSLSGSNDNNKASISNRIEYKYGKDSDDAVETITLANGVTEKDLKSQNQQEYVVDSPSPHSDTTSSSISTSTSASMVSRASYWAGEASHMMGSLYLMASDGVEALSKTASMQAAARTVVGAKGAMMNKLYGLHGCEVDELSNVDIFGSLTEAIGPNDLGGREYDLEVGETSGISPCTSGSHRLSPEDRRELGIKAIIRTNKLSRISVKADSLLECEKLVCKALGELSVEFMKLSDLEGNSSMGHVSASFDSSSYGKSLQRYASTRNLAVRQGIHQIFGNIRLLARYRESIKNTVDLRERYKKQLKLRQSHINDAKMKSEKATKYAKELAETFAAQSSNKSPVKMSKLNPNLVSDNTERNGPITIPELNDDDEEKKSHTNNDERNSSDNSNGLFFRAQKLGLSTTTLRNFMGMVSEKIVGTTDPSAPVSANQVFNAQAASAKAIQDLEKAELSLYCVGKEADLLQARMESDLVSLERAQRQELQNKLVEFVKIQISASKSSMQIWEDFGSRLESFGGDSLSHGAIDKFL